MHLSNRHYPLLFKTHSNLFFFNQETHFYGLLFVWVTILIQITSLPKPFDSLFDCITCMHLLHEDNILRINHFHAQFSRSQHSQGYLFFFFFFFFFVFIYYYFFFFVSLFFRSIFSFLFSLALTNFVSTPKSFSFCV